VLRHRLDNLTGVKDLWTAIEAKTSINNTRANSLIPKVESANKHFANNSFDPHYNLEAVTAFRQDVDPNDYTHYLSS